ncbi:hypothetical protein BS47DRAFT_1367870 [Hydnum rufescens UP504]|uniref:Uncharacterized protein n=1 Tax=Hydnum rufescens UP504 TaxID=1448309 RepID=A0A9P6DPI6_9AGAM|nr:hypothetical protein BS47DRAFT_1367870 [Hydnum rufescens UP504]
MHHVMRRATCRSSRLSPHHPPHEPLPPRNDNVMPSCQNQCQMKPANDNRPRDTHQTNPRNGNTQHETTEPQDEPHPLRTWEATEAPDEPHTCFGSMTMQKEQHDPKQRPTPMATRNPHPMVKCQATPPVPHPAQAVPHTH